MEAKSVFHAVDLASDFVEANVLSIYRCDGLSNALVAIGPVVLASEKRRYVILEGHLGPGAARPRDQPCFFKGRDGRYQLRVVCLHNTRRRIRFLGTTVDDHKNKEPWQVFLVEPNVAGPPTKVLMFARQRRAGDSPC